jgi:hypothetical protein
LAIHIRIDKNMRVTKTNVHVSCKENYTQSHTYNGIRTTTVSENVIEKDKIVLSILNSLFLSSLDIDPCPMSIVCFV